jgi:hypothetical protein
MSPHSLTRTRHLALKRFVSLPSAFLTRGIDGETGNGDNVLTSTYGADIDAHDFVVRFNTMMDGYRKFVGSKTDGMWNKPNYDKTTEKWVPSPGLVLLGLG